MKLNNKNPRFYFQNEYLYSDLCIWCLQKEKLTKSHLIPDSLGSNFYTFTSCEKCNSYLGREIESKTKNNAFISSALSKLRLATKKEAYRHSRKFDTETGAEMHITDEGVSRIAPKKILIHNLLEV